MLHKANFASLQVLSVAIHSPPSHANMNWGIKFNRPWHNYFESSTNKTHLQIDDLFVRRFTICLRWDIWRWWRWRFFRFFLEKINPQFKIEILLTQCRHLLFKLTQWSTDVNWWWRTICKRSFWCGVSIFMLIIHSWNWQREREKNVSELCMRKLFTRAKCICGECSNATLFFFWLN